MSSLSTNRGEGFSDQAAASTTKTTATSCARTALKGFYVYVLHCCALLLQKAMQKRSRTGELVDYLTLDRLDMQIDML